MSYNPYAPPTAVVDDAPASEAPFFAIGSAKLLVMSICTLGLYQVVWFYRHWRCVQRRDRSSIWPVPRALFAWFFCFALFDRIRRDGQARLRGGAPSMGPLAVAWVGLTLLQHLPGPAGFVCLLAVLPMVTVQDYANRLNAVAAPGHDANTRLSALNWLAVVIGGGLLVACFFAEFRH